MPTNTDLPVPFRRYKDIVRSEWIDYNGHMNVGFYLLVFEEAARSFFSWLDLSKDYRNRTGCGFFVSECHMTFEREVSKGQHLNFETQLLDIRKKVVRVIRLMHSIDTPYLAATNEVLYVHVNLDKRASVAIPKEKMLFLNELFMAHKHLPRPRQVGQSITVC